MNIYYKRKDYFCKYPFHTEIDYSEVCYSKTKKPFIIFAKTDVSLNMVERAKYISSLLNVKKIKLIKT